MKKRVKLFFGIDVCLFLCLVFLMVFLFNIKVSAASGWTFPTNGGTSFTVICSYENSGTSYYSRYVVNCPDEGYYYAFCYDLTYSDGRKRLSVYRYALGGSSSPEFAKDVTALIYGLDGTPNGSSSGGFQFWNPLYLSGVTSSSIFSDLYIFDSVSSMKNYCLYGDESGISWKPTELEDIMPPLENASYDSTLELKDFFVERDDNYVYINWSGFKLSDVMQMLALNSGENPYSYVFVEFGYSPSGGAADNSDIVWKEYDKFYRANSGGCQVALSDIAADSGYYLSRVRVTPYYYTEPPTLPDNVVGLTRLPFSPFLRVGNRYTVSWSELGNQSGFVHTDNPKDDLKTSEDKQGNFIDTFWSTFTGFFLPGESYFQNYYENINLLFMDHFGGLYQVVTLVIDFFQDMLDSANEANPCLHFPGIQWLDGTYLAEPQDIYIMEYWSFYPNIRAVCYLATDTILIGCFLLLLQNKIRGLLRI